MFFLTMGNTESMPEKKEMRRIKTEDETFYSDKSKVACDRDMTKNSLSVESGTETSDRGETVTTDKCTLTNDYGLMSEIKTSQAVENSSLPDDVIDKHMWEEVAMRYQQILHREYRMLNLPSYPVQGGSVYLYYVPVIINPRLGPAELGADDEYDKKPKAADHGTCRAKSDEFFYISRDNRGDDCITRVKKEQLKLEQKVEISCSFRKHIKKETFPRGLGLCSDIVESHCQCGKISYACHMKNDQVQVKVEKDFDNSNSCIEFKQDKAAVDEPEKCEILNNYVEKTEQHQRQADCYNDRKLEVREGHIRVFNGYTIEYHPLCSAGTPYQPLRPTELETQQDRERIEKIRDLKKRLAEQEEELGRLRVRPMLERNVSVKEHANGIVKEKRLENGMSEFTSPISQKRLRDCPSVQIHYFPSGERRTSPPRRISRKQTSPRRIGVLSSAKANDTRTFDKSAEIEVTLNGDFSCSDPKRKRKLTPPLKFQQGRPIENKRARPVQYQTKWPMHGQRRKEAKVRRNPRETRSISRVSDQSLPTGSQRSGMKNGGKLSRVENTSKTIMPQDLHQDEFLSIFGLARISRKHIETLKLI